MSSNSQYAIGHDFFHLIYLELGYTGCKSILDWTHTQYNHHQTTPSKTVTTLCKWNETFIKTNKLCKLYIESTLGHLELAYATSMVL